MKLYRKDIAKIAGVSKLLFPSTKYLPTPGTDGSGTEILCDVIFELFGGVCGSDRCG